MGHIGLFHVLFYCVDRLLFKTVWCSPNLPYFEAFEFPILNRLKRKTAAGTRMATMIIAKGSLRPQDLGAFFAFSFNSNERSRTRSCLDGPATGIAMLFDFNVIAATALSI